MSDVSKALLRLAELHRDIEQAQHNHRPGQAISYENVADYMKRWKRDVEDIRIVLEATP